MKKISLLSVLLLSSSFVYANVQWISEPSKYKGDCREMMCDCVEDNDGKGHCCPKGTSSKNTGGESNKGGCYCPIEAPVWDAQESRCVECLANYGSGAKGSCTTEQKPLCHNNSCQACPPEKPVWDRATQECLDKCFEKSDCPSGHYCSNGECLACPNRVTIPTYRGGNYTSDNRSCIIGTRIGSTNYKKNKPWTNPYQCSYNVYFSGTLDTGARRKAKNNVYLNGQPALGHDTKKYTYSNSHIGTIGPGGNIEVEIYNNSGYTTSSLTAWMELAK